VLYGNGVFAAVSGGGGTYGDSNVNTLLSAWGSNSLSTTGNVNSTNITLPANGRIYGDFGNANIAARTALQASSATFTAMNVLPGVGYSATGTTTAAGLTTWGGTDTGNATQFGLRTTGQDVRLVAGQNGTATAVPMTFVVNNSTTAMTISNIGNIGMGNTSPLDKLAVTGNVYVSGNVRGGNITTPGVISSTGTATLGAVTYTATDGTAGQVLTTYGNGITYFAAGGGGTYGDSNVNTLLAAWGSNTISTSGNITSGNVIATNIGNVAALNLNGNASTVLYGNGVFAAVAGGSSYGDSNVVTLMSAFGSNTISTTGAVSTGNITLRTNGRIFGDWGNVTTNSKTFFQSSNVSTSTLVSAIPPVGYAPVASSLLSGWWSYANADAGNTAFVYTSISGTDARIRSGNTGTGTALPLTIYVGTTSTERFRIDLNGNVGIGCTAPNSALVVGSYTGNSINGASDILLAGNINVQGGFVRVGTPNATGTLFNTAGTINIGTTSAVGVNIGPTSGITATVLNGNANVTNTLTFANIARSGGAPTAATDTTIAYKVPIVINGTTYYIALTAAV